MKTTYSVIIIIACLAVAIVGWNGLMNTLSAENVAPSNSGSNNHAGGAYKEFFDSNGHPGASPQKTADPRTGPVAILFAGVIGMIFGAHSLITNMRTQTPKKVPTGG